jgi:hypothetical protein
MENIAARADDSAVSMRLSSIDLLTLQDLAKNFRAVIADTATMQRLENRGLISGDWCVTDHGRETLASWQDRGAEKRSRFHG